MRLPDIFQAIDEKNGSARLYSIVVIEKQRVSENRKKST
jgi:hypothetical protein